MEKHKEAEASSPVATVDDIQKRLLGPPLHSQLWRDRISSQISSKLNENSHALRKKKMQVTRIQRLEDYLDPVLLSTVRAKISGERKNYYGVDIKKTTKCELHEFDLFQWPDEDHSHLKAFTGGSTETETSRVKQEDANDATDLNKN